MFFSTPSSSLESLSRLTPLVLGQESLEIAEIFESAKLPLFVAYYRRCYARFLRLKKLLESQKYGKITAVHYRMERLKASKGAGWRENASISGGGFFVDVGSHALDLLDFLLGPLQQLSGVAVRERGSDPAAPEEAVTVSFACAQSEAIGTLVCFLERKKLMQLLAEVLGLVILRQPDLDILLFFFWGGGGGGG